MRPFDSLDSEGKTLPRNPLGVLVEKHHQKKKKNGDQTTQGRSSRSILSFQLFLEVCPSTRAMEEATQVTEAVKDKKHSTASLLVLLNSSVEDIPATSKLARSPQFATFSSFIIL